MKLFYVLALLISFVLCSHKTVGQFTKITIAGHVSDTANNPLPWASIKIKGTNKGVTASKNGDFFLTTAHPLPFTLVISIVGYEQQEILVNNASDKVQASLKNATELDDVMVKGDGRYWGRYIESSGSVYRMNNANIRNAAAPDYYSGIANMSGVDFTTSSLTFQTLGTRGFNGSGNLRFTQLTEGMDNQAPGLSFSVGSIIGLTELDVDNVELIAGASSALYGSGGTNGTLLITGKSPFDQRYQGLSVQYKQGVNHLSDPRHNAAPVFDGELRFAKAIKNKFAFKIAAKYLSADDWQADDSTNLLRSNVLYSSIKDGNRKTDPNYDGINVYGDEASASMQAFAQAVRAGVATQLGSAGYTQFDNYLNGLISGSTDARQLATTVSGSPFSALVPMLPFLLPTSTEPNNPYKYIYNTQLVSRLGYSEKTLVDYKAYNFKITGGLYYKITKDIEASVQAYFGRGTTINTGSDRYVLKNLQVAQYKLELKSANWFLRGYTTQENSGDSYIATTAAIAINSAWKSNSAWFQQYTGAYGAARLGLSGLGASDQQAHQVARAVAESGRYLPGTQQYIDAFNKAVNTPISQGGAKFTDKTNLYHAEGQYNFTKLVKVVDVLAGASYRVYHLNSGGTIFADTKGPINISEYGAYVQLQKKLLDSMLKLTVSGRYDKNENFKGRFTPRFSALIKIAKDNNIRLSYQVAYRFPSTQDQYLNLQTPKAKLIGGLPSFNTLYHFDTDPAYTAESIDNYRASGAALQKASFTAIKPETMNSYEIGYRGYVTKGFLIDAYFYTSSYKSFIGRLSVGRGQSGIDSNKLRELASPFTTTYYTFAVNSPETIKANGWGLGLEYRFQKKITASVNISGDQLHNVRSGFVTFFNTPKVRYNVGLSSPAGPKSFGFNIIYRWQDKVNWESTFGSGEVPSYGTMDGQVSYLVPKAKTLIKLGGSNIFNNYYRSAFGNPYVGALYYISFGYNVF